MYKKDCPREFKELYAQKKITLDVYLNNYKELSSAYYNADGSVKTDPSIDLETTYVKSQEALANWVENQQIYNEFNYYQETKKILGIHPVFKKLLLKEKINKMSELKADKRKRNLEIYIRRDSKKLKTIKAPNSKLNFNKKLENFKQELELIKRIHNFE